VSRLLRARSAAAPLLRASPSPASHAPARLLPPALCAGPVVAPMTAPSRVPLQPTTYHLQPTTYHLQPTTYHLQPTTFAPFSRAGMARVVVIKRSIHRECWDGARCLHRHFVRLGTRGFLDCFAVTVAVSLLATSRLPSGPRALSACHVCIYVCIYAL
jgi:hypothetical protein